MIQKHTTSSTVPQPMCGVQCPHCMANNLIREGGAEVENCQFCGKPLTVVLSSSKTLQKEQGANEHA